MVQYNGVELTMRYEALKGGKLDLPITDTQKHAEIPIQTCFTSWDFRFYLRSIRLQRRATADGEIVFPGSHVQPCLTEMSCVPMDKCPQAFALGDRKRFPHICKWDGNNPFVCCPLDDTNAKIKTQLTQFPEEDCARSGVTLPVVSDEHSRKPEVVGGINVNRIETYPFMVSIYQTTDIGREFLCGGSLLSTTVILTAAHCFLHRDSSSKYLVRIGSREIQSNENDTDFKELVVTSVKVHPEFRYPQLYNDIALIKYRGLTSYSPRARPICLMGKTADDESKSPLTIMGWGSTQSGGSGSKILQEADVNVTANSECEATLGKLGVLPLNFPTGISSDIICAGNTNNISRDACQGDSGGPAVVLVDGIWRQRGIVSGGIGCGIKGVPGLYTRVSQHTDWIRQNA